MDASKNSALSIAVPFKGLYFSDYRLYLLSAGTIALAVAAPVWTHQFGALGASLLPMPFFILLAGLTLGWRAGLLIGLLSPLASYLLSGMPFITLLPQITLESMGFGFAAGLLRERFNLSIVKSLVLSMLCGWLMLLLAVTVIFWGRSIPSPLMLPWVAGLFPAGSSALSYVAAALLTGLPGIVLQLALIPFACRVADRWLQKV
ncbi:MAG: ECF transporter S component [Dehalococcoidia bacterium]|jgi:niacin transporter